MEKLVCKLAWRYARSRGEFEELQQEAWMALYEAQRQYKDVGFKFTTYAYTYISGRLRRYRQATWKHRPTELVQEPATETTPFIEFFDELSVDAQELCRIIFEDPADLGSMPPKMARGTIKNRLRAAGWAWSKIWSTFSEMQEVCNAH